MQILKNDVIFILHIFKASRIKFNKGACEKSKFVSPLVFYSENMLRCSE